MITGGSGFIGSHLAMAFIDDGHDVVVMDRKDRTKIPCTHARVDITDLDSVKSHMKDVEYVFHMAGEPSVEETMRKPVETSITNVIGTLNMLEASRYSNVKKFIFASSAAVYGDSGTPPVNEVRENLNPLSPYGLQKIQSEQWCDFFSDTYGLGTVSLRYFNVYGPPHRPKRKYSAVIPRFIDAIINDRKPVIYGDGLQSRDFIYIDDVIEANRLAMKSNITKGIFNIGSKRSTNINDLLYAIYSLLGKEVQCTYTISHEGDIRHSLGDITKAKTLLKFNPQYGLMSGLKKTIDWFIGESQNEKELEVTA